MCCVHSLLFVVTQTNVLPLIRLEILCRRVAEARAEGGSGKEGDGRTGGEVKLYPREGAACQGSGWSIATEREMSGVCFVKCPRHTQQATRDLPLE